ncbi:hypothetical protein KP509_33G050700 [Ceratopteris richardii]|uniref:Cyclin N-terminal domain-containing protein n=1 Tax=Ceratopteris richardii TaxID=49495 RepID=A0A8T2QPY9_CERRI|nr:hypothetical protein KP509_33G050700 [Ceratopteris richardii]KAH7285906.1 hypothetical protein KP509_33G050700 [Ceratopteris richardii]KAH7285907.1 hypothetical protein KP509_33G050700 [Ceratopteris richardii]KAH7285908.1 hypothetical protein KP509_33G050700 [Ceratopteris richardii]KAH7285909.1 hypothetical protein KP509_33G050700 [Ceratopteris richardii]
MAGSNDQARRMRTRETLGPSVVRPDPAPMSNNVGASDGASKNLKASVKRAANEDNQRFMSAATSQQAKKRAALTNLTNQNQFPGGHGNGPAKARANIAKNKSHASLKHSDISQKNDVTVGARAKSSHPNQEESLLANASGPSNVEIQEQMSPSEDQDRIGSVASMEDVAINSTHDDDEADPIAALEKETKLSLYISNKPEGAIVIDENSLGNESNLTRSHDDPDSNSKDPQLCSSYAKDIYQYLRISELKRRPTVDYMDSIQHDINSSMRGILVDWLVEVAEEYKLVPDTLYLTVSYIDRFLSAKVVNRQRLQLLGVACMLVAAKYEEICAPQVEEFCYITDNTYCKEEVLDMERQVLNHLHFELTGPTTKTFLRRFLRAAQPSSKSSTLHMEYMGNYLAELSLVDYDFLKYLPSMVAASAVFVARFTFEPHVHPWNSALQHHTGYKPSAIKGCVQAVHGLQHNISGCTLPAIREKYCQHKFKCVAKIASSPVIPSEYFEDCGD